MSAPLAPWELAGESIVGLARWRGGAAPLPVGLRRVPGPSLVAATRYSESPVGPFLELVVGHPARLGLRFGWHISETVVTQEDARLGGRLNWGFPSDMADLEWEVDGDERALVWPSRGLRGAGTTLGRAAAVAGAGASVAASQRRVRDRPRPSARPGSSGACRRRSQTRRPSRRHRGRTPRARWSLDCGRRCTPRGRHSASRSRLSHL